MPKYKKRGRPSKSSSPYQPKSPGAPPKSAYELQREANIRANNLHLEELGLLNPVKPLFELKGLQKKLTGPVTKRAPSSAPRKRSVPVVLDDADRRRSSRLSGRPPINFAHLDQVADPDTSPRRRRSGGAMLRAAYNYDPDDVWGGKLVMTCKEMYRFNPPEANRGNIMGEVDGVPVGFTFYSREEACWSGVHRPMVAGIHGDQECAYSVVLNGGYEDDVDHGDCFVLTGSGGRDLKGTAAKPKNLRTAKQSKDQELSGKNLSLSKNKDLGHPIRVLRGHKLDSEFAPGRGFRYDGLYSVEGYNFSPGLEGFNVYRFFMRRCDGQAPPPWENENNDSEE